MGSPDPQPQSVIVDTGSGLLAVPGAECRRCSRTHIDPPYDPKKSDSSVHLTCVIFFQYLVSETPSMLKKLQKLGFWWAMHFLDILRWGKFFARLHRWRWYQILDLFSKLTNSDVFRVHKPINKLFFNSKSKWDIRLSSKEIDWPFGENGREAFSDHWVEIEIFIMFKHQWRDHDYWRTQYKTT